MEFNSTEDLKDPVVTIMGEEILDDQGTDWITLSC